MQIFVCLYCGIWVLVVVVDVLCFHRRGFQPRSSSGVIYFLLCIPAQGYVLHIRTVLNQRQRILGRSITV